MVNKNKIFYTWAKKRFVREEPGKRKTDIQIKGHTYLRGQFSSLIKAKGNRKFETPDRYLYNLNTQRTIFISQIKECQSSAMKSTAS